LQAEREKIHESFQEHIQEQVQAQLQQLLAQQGNAFVMHSPGGHCSSCASATAIENDENYYSKKRFRVVNLCTLFWCDRWLHGKQVGDLAPRLLVVIPKRRANKCTELEALTDYKWISNIRVALTVEVLMDYLHLWSALADVELLPGGNRFSLLEICHEWAV
jgi:hypothetical protein